MAQPYEPDPQQPRLTPRQVRDMAGAVLVLLGSAGLTCVAFLTDPLLGCALLSTIAIAGGLGLAYQRK